MVPGWSLKRGAVAGGPPRGSERALRSGTWGQGSKAPQVPWTRPCQTTRGVTFEIEMAMNPTASTAAGLGRSTPRAARPRGRKRGPRHPVPATIRTVRTADSWPASPDAAMAARIRELPSESHFSAKNGMLPAGIEPAWVEARWRFYGEGMATANRPLAEFHWHHSSMG